MKQIPTTAPKTCLDQILIGLSGVDSPDDVMCEAILFAFERAPIEHGDMIVQAIRSMPHLGRNAAIWHVLTWYTQHGEAREPNVRGDWMRRIDYMIVGYGDDRRDEEIGTCLRQSSQVINPV